MRLLKYNSVNIFNSLDSSFSNSDNRDIDIEIDIDIDRALGQFNMKSKIKEKSITRGNNL